MSQKRTPIKRRRTLSKEAILETLRKAFGNVTLASELLQCGRSHLSRKINADDPLKQATNEGLSRLVDTAHNALVERIRAGDTAAIIYLPEEPRQS